MKTKTEKVELSQNLKLRISSEESICRCESVWWSRVNYAESTRGKKKISTSM